VRTLHVLLFIFRHWGLFFGKSFNILLVSDENICADPGGLKSIELLIASGIEICVPNHNVVIGTT
jgi:hypothetical protein